MPSLDVKICRKIVSYGKDAVPVLLDKIPDTNEPVDVIFAMHHPTEGDIAFFFFLDWIDGWEDMTVFLGPRWDNVPDWEYLDEDYKRIEEAYEHNRLNMYNAYVDIPENRCALQRRCRMWWEQNAHIFTDDMRQRYPEFQRVSFDSGED